MKNLLKYAVLISLFSVCIIYNLLPTQKKISSHTHLTGDWFGIRNDISEFGLDFEISYKNDFIYIPTDLLHNTAFDIQNLDIDLLFDLEKIIGLSESLLLFDVQLINGHLPNTDHIHSAQGISNIEADNNFLIYEFFFTKKLFNNRFSVKLGLVDFNSEFDVKESGLNFITPSHGIGTDFALSGKNGPSIFPVTSLAFVLNADITKNLSLKLGIFDGIPGDTSDYKGTNVLLTNTDGLLLTSEAEYRISNENKPESNHTFAAGAWGITNKILGDATQFQTYGFYLSANLNIFSEPDDESQGLSGYIRLGYVNSTDNPTDFFAAVALQYKGIFGRRDNDFLGIGFAWSSASDEYREIIKQSNPDFSGFDANIELYYKAQILPFLFIQPIAQYFISPLLNSKQENSFVIAIRTTVML